MFDSCFRTQKTPSYKYEGDNNRGTTSFYHPLAEMTFTSTAPGDAAMRHSLYSLAVTGNPVAAYSKYSQHIMPPNILSVRNSRNVFG